MSDRPTPETDAFSVKFRSVCGSKSWVPTDICRRFERERDKAREDATNYYARIGELEKERDEAREDAAKWESSSDAMERAGAEQARRADENREWALKAERERDEAREAAYELAKQAERLRKERDQLKEALLIMENLLKPGIELFPEIGEILKQGGAK